MCISIFKIIYDIIRTHKKKPSHISLMSVLNDKYMCG